LAGALPDEAEQQGGYGFLFGRFGQIEPLGQFAKCARSIAAEI
jgi:hypothetical protein